MCLPGRPTGASAGAAGWHWRGSSSQTRHSWPEKRWSISAVSFGDTWIVACDTDMDARLATSVNARLNGVAVEISERLPDRSDILLMADVLYDKQNLPLLSVAQAHADEVLVADSRVTELPDPAYREVARIEALTYPNLGEFDEYRNAPVFRWAAPNRESLPIG